jgi:hypothetical protein
MTNPRGYDYPALLHAVAERDNGKCFVRELLVARRQAKIDEWSGGQADGMDPACREDWIPASLLDCRERLDACHVLSKSWLKDAYPNGALLVAPGSTLVPALDGYPGSLAVVLNDPRNAVLNCRRHHGLMDRKLVVVRRADLPGHVEEFAQELGDRAVARLERDFGRAPVTSPVSSLEHCPATQPREER